MDRFESVLKTAFRKLFKPYLHSNMDRFESNDFHNYRCLQDYIYIPIWIDLKAQTAKAFQSALLIYIPIWIDLKDIPFLNNIILLEIYIPIWIDLKGTLQRPLETC